MLDERGRRIAANESRFREINERLEEGLRRLPPDGQPADFICECGLSQCSDTVRVTFEEYERVRSDPLLFVVLPGHEIPDVEDVVSRTERFFVLRKGPESQPLVEATDPRS